MMGLMQARLKELEIETARNKKENEEARVADKAEQDLKLKTLKLDILGEVSVKID
jgi:hypothetical protein